MMRFITITNKLMEAIVEMCIEQEDCCYDYEANEIRAMLEAAFSELGKIRNGVLPLAILNRYVITASDDYTGELILPAADRNNALFVDMAHLAYFKLDSYISDDGRKTVERGYDIVYVEEYNEVIPVFTLTVTDDDITSVYRVESFEMDNFNTPEFIISLAVQLADKLRNGADFIGRVCDCPCD